MFDVCYISIVIGSWLSPERSPDGTGEAASA